MIEPSQYLPETWTLALTAPHLEAIEYLSKSEAEDFRAWFRQERRCWYCHKPIDPDEPQDGHDADCLCLACCDLAAMTDSE